MAPRTCCVSPRNGNGAMMDQQLQEINNNLSWLVLGIWVVGGFITGALWRIANRLEEVNEDEP
jgi:hypothetical protein